jgi:phage shock protein PspC (stress-responsive transcriptional regulator)
MAKKLTRSPDDRWIAGICGGLAEYTGIDATVIRVILLVATILGAGSLIVIYLICWLLIPLGTESSPYRSSQD